MTVQPPGRSGPDYLHCRYGASKLLFRGPKRRLIAPYVTCLGGSETFGRFTELPYPAQLAEALDLRIINLGCPNGGIDVYLKDESLIEIARKGAATVIELSGAQLNSNRFYAVHPRRNDRFLRASGLLSTIYPEVDFMQYHFVRHLLTDLKARSDVKFAIVEQELRDAWTARMQTLIQRIGGPVILLWMSRRTSGASAGGLSPHHEPLMVDHEMIARLGVPSDDIVRIDLDPGEVLQGQDEMMFGPEDTAAALEMLGTVAHRRAAAALSARLERLL